MNKKGFTLVELIAVITVLGLIMVIAVPSTINIIEKNKKESFISDAKKFLRLVEQKNKSDNICTSFSLSKYISNCDILTGNFKKSPYNNAYSTSSSSVYYCNMTIDDKTIYYYHIIFSDDEYILDAYKGVPDSKLNAQNKNNIMDNTSKRYNMVQKKTKSSIKSCDIS